MSHRFGKYILIATIFLIFGFSAAQDQTASSLPVKKCGILNVVDFGAKGDGKTDDTSAFQKALNKAGENEKGGTVFAPQNTYLIAKHLIIPKNVTLQGIWNIPTAWTQYQGTTLLATEGEGNPKATPFITLGTNSVLKGITVFYPNQVKTNPPKPYPWCIAGAGGDNSSIIDVLLVNPYLGVDFGTHPCGRHYIRNLYAQPFLKGLYVDQCYDIGRVENVHFWPFWTCNNPEMKGIQDFISENGEAFIFGRTDWEYVYNTFSWGYKVGYHFIKTKSGVANGNFLGIGADATNRALLVDDCAPYGLLITNGEFVSMFGPQPTSVEIRKSNTGVIQLQNCSFWGPSSQIAAIRGIGTAMFNNCNFVFWDHEQKKLPAIDCFGGSLIVSSSNFNRPGNHIRLNKGTSSAVITGNRFTGKAKITNNSDGDVQIGLNAQGLKRTEEPGAIVIDDSADPPLFRTEGKWYEGQGGRDYGDICHWAYKGTGDAKAFWQPELDAPGMYKVFIWYGGDPMENHATNAKIVVKHKNGEETLTVNLRKNTGSWNLLGKFEFEKGGSGYVMISNDANDNIMADAVKFLPE